MGKLRCFKAYDIRGRIPDELNDELAYQIGRSYAGFVRPKRVAVGRDIRQSSVSLRLCRHETAPRRDQPHRRTGCA